MIYRLKDEHPLHDKLKKIFSLMDELGISFHADGLGVLYVKDKNYTQDIYFRTCGMTSQFGPVDANNGASELPPMFDYDLIYRKDE